jgi:hypothetical protein
MRELYHQYTCFSLFVGVLLLLSSSRAGTFADAGMADDGGDREGKELGEQQLVVATAAVVVPIVVSQKKLLVLDVNGLLVATYYKQETLPPEPYHVKLGNFYGDTSILHVFFSFFLSLSLSLSLSLFYGGFYFPCRDCCVRRCLCQEKERFSTLRSFLVILGFLLHPSAEDYQGFASDVMFLEGVLLRTRICLIVCFLLPQCTRGHFVTSSFAFAWKTLPLESGLRHKREFRPAFLHA